MPNVYNGGFPMGYQQIQQPQQYYPQPQYPMQGMQPQQDQRTIHGFDWVIGMQGANAYAVPAGKTFVLFDASPDSHSFFLKSTDITGKPFPPIMFDYEQHKEELQQAPSAPAVDLSGYVPVKQFEALKAELEALKSKPMPDVLTAEDVRDMFDQMIEQRFARVSVPAESKPRKVAAEK